MSLTARSRQSPDRPAPWIRRILSVRTGSVMGGALANQKILGALLVLLSVMTAVGMALAPPWVPPAAMLVVLLASVVVLRRAAMITVAAVIVVEVAILVGLGAAELTPGTIIVIATGLVLSMLFVRSREQLGLQGAPSQLMLVDLRDRIAAHGRIPSLPAGWHVESVLRSAHGDGFSGDFVVAARRTGGTVLEIALVDVSGKGQDAGVRSLLLSGAFGGLLGALPTPDFLPTANAYLLGQDWSEGFATALHLALNLDSGAFRLASAGHLPAVHLHAASGRFEVLWHLGGPVLGVVAAPSFPGYEGVLDRGDTLILYTDGVVEARNRGLDQGIDRLMGAVEGIVVTARGGAAEVLDELRAGEEDDRALVLIRRT